MIATNIFDILKSFFEDNNYRAILIDGKWGIGKTYQVRKFFDSLKRKERKRIYYFTVFGTESGDELNTKIYRKLHPFWSIMKVGYKTISKSVDAVAGLNGSSLNINANLDYVLDLVKPEKIKKNPILIFDDIERFSDDNFSMFLGLIYKFNLQGARVICLTSSEKIHDRNNCFGEYKEKIFDAIYKIHGASENVVNEIFKEIEEPEKKYYLLDVCDNNIRTLKRASILYSRICKTIKMEEQWKVNKFLVQCACCFTIKIVLDPNLKIEKNEKKSFLYLSLIDEFDENIACNYINFVSKFQFSAEEKTIPSLIRCILKVYLFNDFSDLLSILLPVDMHSTSLLDKSYFLLSDENKKSYFHEFNESLKNPETIFDKKYLQRFAEIIRYSNFEISDELIQNMANFLYKDSISKVSTKINENIVWLDGFLLDIRNEPIRAKVEPIILKMKSIIKEKNVKYHTNKLLTAFSTKDYSTLLIYSDKFSVIKEDLDLVNLSDNLTRNKFYLPDLSKNITQNEWDFCHTIGTLVHLLELDNQFIEFAKSSVNAKPESFCLKERLEALIRYRLGQNIKL